MVTGLVAKPLTIDSYMHTQEKLSANQATDLIEKAQKFNISNAKQGYLPQIGITAIEIHHQWLAFCGSGAPSDNGISSSLNWTDKSNTLDGARPKSRKT